MNRWDTSLISNKNSVKLIDLTIKLTSDINFTILLCPNITIRELEKIT